MSRLTVRLPNSLHEQLETGAREEGVSLNQYIVYALTRQTSPLYTIRATPESAIAEQRAQFDALRARLGRVSPEDLQQTLEEREQVAPDPDLDPLAAERVRQIAAARRTPRRPRKSLRGAWRGLDVSDEDIAAVRRDMWSGFPREDAR